jgi:hypothetical protein
MVRVVVRVRVVQVGGDGQGHGNWTWWDFVDFEWGFFYCTYLLIRTFQHSKFPS